MNAVIAHRSLSAVPILPVAVKRRFTMLRVTILLFVSIAFLGGAADAADRARALAVADSLANLWQDEPETLPSFDSTMTLDEYLLIAMKRNPGLKSAYYRWIADLSTSGYAGSLPDPMLTYGYFMESVETRVGPQEQRFSLRQSFPWFGTLGAKEDIAFARSQASYRKFEAARLLLFFRGLGLWFGDSVVWSGTLLAFGGAAMWDRTNLFDGCNNTFCTISLFPGGP